MSHTIRRKNIINDVPAEYIVPGDIAETKSKSYITKLADNLFHGDRTHGYSAPKSYRQMINRMERYQAKNNIRLALFNNTLDNFVDVKMRMPYWD